MSRKLLIEDYTDLTKGAFKHNIQDFYNYYLNFINMHFKYNDDIIQRVLESINGWIDWYRDIVFKHVIWEVDEFGNKTLMDREYQVNIPLDSYFGIRKHINKSFFDQQIDVVNAISKIIDYYKLLIQLENQLEYETILEIKSFKQLSEIDLDLDTLNKKRELINKGLEKDRKKLAREKDLIYKNQISKENINNTYNLSSAQWGYIFYYLFNEKFQLIPNSNIMTVNNKIEYFKKKYGITNSKSSLRNDYYIAKKLMSNNNPRIIFLESILPFIEVNYNSITKLVQNDIEVIENYNAENQ